MRSSDKKYWVLKFLTIVAVVCISSISVFGEDANAPPVAPPAWDVNALPAGDVNALPAGDVNALPAGDVNKPAVRAPFEQRMQKRISVEFRNTPMEDVIRLMAQQADIDVIKSPGVTGAVTVTLRNVPLEESLNNILAAHGYSYVLSENMIRVITAADKIEKPEILQTRTYEIVYADVREVVKALDKFKSKQGMVASIEGTSYIIVTDTESRIRDITNFIEKVDRMTPQILVEVRIYDITSKEGFDIGTDWYVGRNTPITEIGRTKTSGRTGTNTNNSTTTGSNTTNNTTTGSNTTNNTTTGSDTTTGSGTTTNNNTATHTTTDVGATMPVTTTTTTHTVTDDGTGPVTEDKTVTTTTGGTDPGTIGDTTTNTATIGSTATTGTTSATGSTSGTTSATGLTSGITSATGLTNTATLGNSLTSGDNITETTAGTWLKDFYGKSNPFTGGGFDKTDGGTLRFGVLNDAVDIELALNILHKQIGAKLLANPRILVLDNETAKIDIISEIPYQQLQQGGQQNFGTTSFKEVGVKLEVTPHLAARDEMIRLKLKPTFSVWTESINVGEAGGVKYPQPVVDKREADTKLLVKNGQTVVLGGLRKRETTQDIRKVPLLGDLPVFGGLFRSESENTTNSELVVFITVWIIKQQPVMSQNEQDAYKITNFKGPKVAYTGAESGENKK